MFYRQSWVLLFIHFFICTFWTWCILILGTQSWLVLIIRGDLYLWKAELSLGWVALTIERRWIPLHSTDQCFLLSILRLISLVSISFVIKLGLWFPEVFVIDNEKTNLICFEDKSQHWVLAVCQALCVAYIVF